MVGSGELRELDAFLCQGSFMITEISVWGDGCGFLLEHYDKISVWQIEICCTDGKLRAFESVVHGRKSEIATGGIVWSYDVNYERSSHFLSELYMRALFLIYDDIPDNFKVALAREWMC